MPRPQKPRPQRRMIRPLVQPKFHTSRGQQVSSGGLTVLATGGTKQTIGKPPPPP